MFHCRRGSPSLKVLSQDTRAVFTTASHAQRAADFIHTAAVNI
jgi:antirestriction protein ArdC